MRTAIILAMAVCFLSAAALPAQSPSGVLQGEVRDPSGLPVPDAEVRVENLERTLRRTARTSQDGTFRAEGLEPGAYRIEVEKSGFARYEITRVELQIRQTVDLQIALALGTRSDVVKVEGAVTPLDAAPGSTGSAYGSAQIQELPLDVRNFIGLLQLSPGAIPRHLSGFVHDNNNDAQPGRGAVGLNDPVNGARSTMNSYLLDGLVNTDGNTNALVVNPPLESIQEFRLQSSVSPAEFGYAGGGVVNLVTRSGTRTLHGGLFEFFRNENLDAHTFYDLPGIPNPPFRQNQFGAQLGGPVPRLAGLFFFASYEGLRSNLGNSKRIPAPDTALRQGNLSQLGVDIADPQTGKPFPNSIIPSGRIDSIAQDFLQKFEPFPNGSDGTYTDQTPDQRHTDTASLRLDHNSRFGNFFGRYTTNSDRARLAGNYPVLPASENLRAQQAALGHIYAGSRFVNDLRLGYTRLAIAELPENAFRRDVIGELGITGIDRDPINYGVPTFILPSYQVVVDDPTLPQSQRDQTFQAVEGLTLQCGRHTLKFGGDLQRFQMNFLQRSNSRGRYNFSGAFTGSDFADFLLGLPQDTTRTVGVPLAYLRRLSYSFYGQEEVRVRPGLTLSAGVRYEYSSPFTEKYDHFYNLDYSVLPAPPPLVRAGGKFGRSLIDADRNNFAPRVGLAWKLGHALFRGGYGIFYSPEIAVEAYDLVRNGVLNEMNHVPADRPLLTLRNGFPSGASTGFPTYFGLDRHAATPYVQQWNGGWQAGLKSWLLQANYVGAKGTHLGRYRAFNTPAQVELGRNLPPRPGDIQALRSFPSLGKLFQRQHIANSIYHALELRAERRFSQGLGFQGSFVWAKSIDDADGVIAGLYDGAGAQDERNLRLERGLSFFDVRKRFTANLVYDLPVGKGRRFQPQGPLGKVVSGWQTSAIVLLQDGTPSNPFFFFTDFANSDTPNRPNVVPGQTLALPRSQQTLERFFNPAVFSDPDPYTFGNAGRNILPGPGNTFFDFGIHRQFGLGESRNLEFRAEIFNIFNHPNWGIPGNNKDFGPLYFGKIFTWGSPRRIQLALKFSL